MRRLSDVTLDQDPLVLLDATTVVEASSCMSERRCGSVAVVDEVGRLVGIFTGRDTVSRVLASGRDAATTRLADVMTRDSLTLSPERTALETLRLMWDGGLRHLPMVKGGRVVGVVSRGDVAGLEVDSDERERDLWELVR
jgi:CBS domain-containing protein